MQTELTMAESDIAIRFSKKSMMTMTLDPKNKTSYHKMV